MSYRKARGRGRRRLRALASRTRPVLRSGGLSCRDVTAGHSGSRARTLASSRALLSPCPFCPSPPLPSQGSLDRSYETPFVVSMCAPSQVKTSLRLLSAPKGLCGSRGAAAGVSRWRVPACVRPSGPRSLAGVHGTHRSQGRGVREDPSVGTRAEARRRHRTAWAELGWEVTPESSGLRHGVRGGLFRRTG